MIFILGEILLHNLEITFVLVPKDNFFRGLFWFLCLSSFFPAKRLSISGRIIFATESNFRLTLLTSIEHECDKKRRKFNREINKKIECTSASANVCDTSNLVSISSTFYEQLLCPQILKAQKDSQVVNLFCAFGIRKCKSST